MNKIKAIIVCVLIFAGSLVFLPEPTTGITAHATIYIDGNADFANKALSEGWQGDGSIGNPYIIENYDINAGTADGIEISNTNVYFIIRNCTIHDGKSKNKDGISFYNVTNGKIQNVSSYNNSDGFCLQSSANNNISTNWLYNNNDGVYLQDSTNNNIISNQIYNTTEDGIYLYSSLNNNISTNKIQNNSRFGIYLHSSSNNILRNNILVNNTYNFGVYGGIYGAVITDFYQDIDTSNTINGKPIYYIIEKSNLVFDETIEAGYLGLVSCSNVLVKNLTLTDNHQGLFLLGTLYTTITLNKIYNNHYGVHLYSSSNNNITLNQIYNNSKGICLSSSSSNNIASNRVYNNDYGVVLSYSSSNNITLNLVHDNSDVGIYLSLSSNNHIRVNQIYNSTVRGGIYLEGSSSNNIISNHVYSNSFGINLSSSSNNITSNHIYSNGDGIYLYDYSENNLINTNLIYNNSGCGIYLEYSSNNKIHYNNIYNNINYGVYSNGYIVNATYNWWGSASGPGGKGPGTGDNVSDNVVYEPWLREPFVMYVSVKKGKTKELPLLLIGAIAIIVLIISIAGLIISKKLKKRGI